MTQETGPNHILLAQLTAEIQNQPLEGEEPPPPLVHHLSTVQLSPDDIELLFGEAPGFSFQDLTGKPLALWDALQGRTVTLLCGNQQPAALTAISAGAPAVLTLLLSLAGLPDNSTVSKALAPIAVWLARVGLNRLCG
jgi:hypothetical protein